jgi:hypothetical protein
MGALGARTGLIDNVRRFSHISGDFYYGSYARTVYVYELPDSGPVPVNISRVLCFWSMVPRTYASSDTTGGLLSRDFLVRLNRPAIILLQCVHLVLGEFDSVPDVRSVFMTGDQSSYWMLLISFDSCTISPP